MRPIPIPTLPAPRPILPAPRPILPAGRPRRPRRARRALLVALLLGALAAATGCSGQAPGVQRLARYAPLLSRPLAERLLPADQSVLDRAHRTNLDYGDDVRPRAADPQDPLWAIARRALADLPAPVAKLAAQHLAAVYLVQGDVGTATTEGVQDRQGRWHHAYIVLNATALERAANDWASWKENSAFRPSAGYTLRVTIEPPETDDRAGAVRFILLHELGHVLGLGLGVHPYWEAPQPLPADTQLSAFAALSWELEAVAGGVRLRSRVAQRFPRLGQVAFYRFANAPMQVSEAPALYEQLARTNLPSLYGTQGVYDDFAESFAIYVHTVLLGRPYGVQVLQDGRPRAAFQSCLVTGACPAKLTALEALLHTAVPGPAAAPPRG